MKAVIKASSRLIMLIPSARPSRHHAVIRRGYRETDSMRGLQLYVVMLEAMPHAHAARSSDSRYPPFNIALKRCVCR